MHLALLLVSLGRVCRRSRLDVYMDGIMRSDTATGVCAATDTCPSFPLSRPLRPRRQQAAIDQSTNLHRWRTASPSRLPEQIHVPLSRRALGQLRICAFSSELWGTSGKTRVLQPSYEADALSHTFASSIAASNRSSAFVPSSSPHQRARLTNARTTYIDTYIDTRVNQARANFVLALTFTHPLSD
jgi:hypothetical protein